MAGTGQNGGTQSQFLWNCVVAAVLHSDGICQASQNHPFTHGVVRANYIFALADHQKQRIVLLRRRGLDPNADHMLIKTSAFNYSTEKVQTQNPPPEDIRYSKGSPGVITGQGTRMLTAAQRNEINSTHDTQRPWENTNKRQVNRQERQSTNSFSEACLPLWYFNDPMPVTS